MTARFQPIAPSSAGKTRTEDTRKGVRVSLSAMRAPTGSVMITPMAMVTGELEISIQRKQDHENQQNCDRADDGSCSLAARNRLYSPPQVMQ